MSSLLFLAMIAVGLWLASLRLRFFYSLFAGKSPKPESKPVPAPTHDKQADIDAVLAQMRARGLTLEDLSARFECVIPERYEQKKGGEAASRVFAWLGGILIFSGLSIYIGMFWTEMNSALRIIVTLGVGLTSYAWAIVMLSSGKYTRAVTPALLMGLFMQTGGWFVLINELAYHGNNWHYPVLFVMGIMAIQQGAAFSRFRLTLLLFALFCFSYSFLFTLFDLLRADEKIAYIGMGISMMALAHAIYKSEHASLSNLGYGVGAIMFYMGLFDLVRHSPAEILFPGIAVANLVYVSMHVRSNALLAVSTFAILAYIGYFTEEHFMHTLGWPLTLVVMGVAFIAVSGMAMKMKRQMKAIE